MSHLYTRHCSRPCHGCPDSQLDLHMWGQVGQTGAIRPQSTCRIAGPRKCLPKRDDTANLSRPNPLAQILKCKLEPPWPPPARQTSVQSTTPIYLRLPSRTSAQWIMAQFPNLQNLPTHAQSNTVLALLGRTSSVPRGESLTYPTTSRRRYLSCAWVVCVYRVR